MNELATVPAALSAETLSALVLNGDLSKLTPGQQVEYYRAICDRVGLDPATQPFKILNLQGKKTLYCDRGGVAQLCKSRNVSHKILSRDKMDDLYIVTAQAKLPDGRETESIGAVNINGLKGEALANAMMKAETKAKRRATLDLVGLGMLDESETGSIPGAITESLPERPVALVAAPESEVDNEEAKAHKTAMKSARAKLNTLLQPCKDSKTFAKARGAFQKEFGKDIWEKITCHNETETFMDLVNEHWSRIDRDLRLNAEIAEVVKQWQIDLDSVVTFEDLDKVEKTLQEYPALRDNATYCDMVSAKGREIGHPHHLSDET